MMPTDCSVHCTPTILSSIRISWDYHPTFMSTLRFGREQNEHPLDVLLHIGEGSQGLSSTYEQAHVDLDLLTLASYHRKIEVHESRCRLCVEFVE